MKLLLKTSVLTICIFLSYANAVNAESTEPERSHIEKVFVHTDRDMYMAGEYLHFRAYLLDDGNEKGLHSGFLYLALRNNNDIIKRATIPVKEYYSSGSLYLPDTLSTGYYEIIANTNWMRNIGEESYFRKTVLIVNRFDQNPISNLNFVEKTEQPEVVFVPESGNFLEGLENNLLVKTNGFFDIDLRDFWVVKESKENLLSYDTIANYKFNTHGFKKFSIVPDSEYNYYIVIDGKEKLYELPELRKTGCVLKVNEENNKLLIDILAAEESPNIDWIRLSHDDKTVYEERVYELPHKSEILLDKENLPNGLLLIQAGARGWGVVTQRFWYNDAYQSEILIETDKTTYNKRDKINLEIDGSNLKDDYAFLSISIATTESFDDNAINIDGYKRALDLVKTLGYSYKDGVALFGKMSASELNDYLINDPFDNSGNNNSENKVNSEYFVEKDKLIISGRVIKRNTDIPIQDARVILNKPDSIINILYSYTNEDGIFNFVLSDFFHDKDLYFYVDPYSIEVDHLIEVFDKFDYKSPVYTSGFANLNNKMDFIKRSQDIVRVNKAYTIDYVKEVNADFKVGSFPPLLFSEANRTINPANYAPLDSLPEISREIIHGWQIRKRAEQYNSRLICQSTGRWLPETPVYFLDGIIAYDVNKLIHLNSRVIQRIEIHNFQWYHGEMYFSGIVGIYTKNYDYLSTLAHRVRTGMIKESLRKPTKYVSPEYNSENEGFTYKPDLRQVLYWNTGTEIYRGKMETISFYTGDLGGKYLINIQGLTSGGKPVNITKEIKIN